MRIESFLVSCFAKLFVSYGETNVFVAREATGIWIVINYLYKDSVGRLICNLKSFYTVLQ